MRKKRNIAAMPFLFTTISVLLAMSAFLYLIYKAVTPDMGTYDAANANYYNSQDGKYYEDAAFKIPANDCTEYLTKLLSTGGEISIPEGNYLCSNRLTIKGKNVSITGAGDKTKIIFSGDGLKGITWESAINNESNLQYYKEDSAQSINISGITFEYKRTVLDSPKTILLLSNVNGVSIKNCNFIADLNNSIPVTLLDIYNGCRNVEVDKVSFVNMTGAGSGGSLWIRNLTSDYTNPANTTQDISVKNCDFLHNTSDEILAVFACRGDIKNVKIAGCTFKEQSVQNVMAVSIYSSENIYTGKVDGVVFENNTLVEEYLKNYLITVGAEGRKNKVSNIVISNNSIDVQNESNTDANKFVIYVSNKGTDIAGVKVVKNDIKTGSLKKTAVIANANEASQNRITGKAKYGIVGGSVSKNDISGIEYAIMSPDTADSNTLSNAGVGVLCSKENSIISSNKISLDKDTGVCGIKVQIPQDKPSNVTISNNKITTYTGKQFGIMVYGTQTMDLGSNTVAGSGKKMQMIN